MAILNKQCTLPTAPCLVSTAAGAPGEFTVDESAHA